MFLAWGATAADICRMQRDPLPLEAAIWRKGREVAGFGNRSTERKKLARASEALFYPLFLQTALSEISYTP